MFKAFALVCGLSTSAFALQVTGLQPWSGNVQYTALDPIKAQKEVFAGRADVALVRTPIRPPRGVGKVLYFPVGVFPVVVAYNLPVDLSLSLQQVCDIYAGRILLWSELNRDFPKIPILSIVRLEPNSASWVLAQSCMHIHPRFRKIGLKANWQAESTLRVTTVPEQQKAMLQTGTLSVFVPENVPEGIRVARLKNWDLDLTPQALAYGYQANPEEEPFPGPFVPLPPVNDIQSYPLRGIVWAVVMQDQAYRGRSKEQAREVRGLLQALSTTPAPNQAPLPQGWVSFPRLYYRGTPFW